MWIELRSGPCRCTQTYTVDEVLGDKRVNRSYIHLTWCLLRSCFDEVFNQSLRCKHDPFEVFCLRHVLDEGVHTSLTLCQFGCSVVCPEVIIAHLGSCIIRDLGLSLEEFVCYRSESIVGQPRCSYDNGMLKEVGHLEFGNHIVRCQCPFPIRELGIFLLELHGINEVYTRIGRQLHVTSLHVQRTIVEHIQLTTETKVLLIGWHKLQSDALILVHVNRIIDIKMIERDGCRAYRRRESFLK